jgi:5-methylcytosine-specific restriction endonuclease McrA
VRVALTQEERKRRKYEYDRAYRIRSRGKRAAYNKAYVAANRAKVYVYRKAWKNKNRQRINAQAMLYRQKRTPEQKARKSAYMIQWRAKRKEHIRKYSNLRYHQNSPKIYRQQRARINCWPESKKEESRKYQAEWMRQWRAANPERTKEIKRRCNEQNRNRFLQRRRELAALPEKKALARASYRKWSQTPNAKDCFKDRLHRKRAKIREVVVQNCTKRIRELRQSTSCHWCDMPLVSADVTIDHIIPLARGGHHIPDNLCAACKPCNCSKKDSLPEEWQSIKRRVP